MNCQVYLLVTNAIRILQKAEVQNPSCDAWALLNHALSEFGDTPNPSASEYLDLAVVSLFDEFVGRRASRQPVSQITGKRWFFEHEFVVNQHVLDPRPETELLVQIVIDLKPKAILDLGVGSGCLLLSVLKKCVDTIGVGIDCSKEALIVAQQNAVRMGLQNRAHFAIGNWLEEVSERFDVIAANPPYITADEFDLLKPEVKYWEPKQALTVGEDGLDAYRAIADQAINCLNHNGRLMLEIGVDQEMKVNKIFTSNGFSLCNVYRDLADRPRVLVFRPVW